MKAGIAQSGRTILAAITAALMVLSVMFVFADSSAQASHIDSTGKVQSNCVEFQVGVTGTKSPADYPSVDITLDSWADGNHTINFTITGLAAGQYVDISVKSGTGIQEPGPYGNGSDTFSNEVQNAISHVRLCVFEEEPTTTTTQATTTTTAPTTTTTTAPTTTTTAPPEPGEIIVQKVVTGDASTTFEFTFNTTGFTLGDNTLAHGQSSSSGDIAAGTYAVSEQPVSGWTQVSATCDDGSPVTNIDVAAGETVTCTFTNTIEAEVEASIVVTVTGSCELDGDEGQGVIDVEISVDDGADVVISDSDGDVIETLSSSGTVIVPEGATYTWEATPNEGFEFPSGSDTSGSIIIETCSEDPETLPFTGLDTGMMSLFASALLGGGLILVNAMRRREEA